MRHSFFLLALGMAWAGSLGASELDLSVSSQTVNLGYKAQSVGVARAGADIEAGIFTNEESDMGIYGKILSVTARNPQSPAFTFGVGAKAYAAEVDAGDTLGGVALGGQLGYVIPSRTAPVQLVLEGYVAPDVTTFGDATQLTDVSGRVELEVSGNSTVGYVGFRHLEAELEGGDTREFDDNVHVGIKFRF